MSLPQIDNLEINKVTEDILLIHQIKAPFHFSCCDGLLVLPKEGRNKSSIVLDLNIEPEYIYTLKEIFGPVLNYVCTHSHMDHIAHVYAWEAIGASIHAPIPEANYLKDIRDFYEGFGFNETIKYSEIEKFGKINGFQNCIDISPYKPGDTLRFENFEVETLPYNGHSKGHVGLYMPNEKILHISCLGFDQLKPGFEGFGPWYGFKDCDIERYLDDIKKAEIMFLEGAEFLTSSHAYIVKRPDTTPFDYMRRKIKENQEKVDNILLKLKPTANFEDKVQKLLKKDIFFPKRKMKGFLRNIYALWESWIITKHLQRSKYMKY